MESRQLLRCDKCENEFVLGADDIMVCPVECKGERLQLTFFVCPECYHIYRVALDDEEQIGLRSEIDSLFQRRRRLQEKLATAPTLVDQRIALGLSDILVHKSERFKSRANWLERQYPGAFEFAALTNGKPTIVYRP